MDSDGSNPAPLVEDGRVNIFPRWAPDGQTVFYTRMSHAFLLEICSTAVAGSAPRTLLVKADENALDGGPGGRVENALDVGPDGRVLFGAQGRYQAFNPANNQTQTLITLPGGQQTGLP